MGIVRSTSERRGRAEKSGRGRKEAWLRFRRIERGNKISLKQVNWQY
jgi:hypothetical protein